MRQTSRFIRRSAVITAFVVFAWLLTYTLEPRRTTYSCRDLRSCLGIRGRHRYHYSLPVPAIPTESEVTLRDGTVRFRREIEEADPDVLFLVLNKDGKSWASDFRSSQRTAYDLMDVLISTGLNLSSASIALMTSSPEEFEKIKAATLSLPFARATILLRQDSDQGFAYTDRHNPTVQLARRSAIATLRNYLMLSSLQDEQYIVWLDADVVELTDGIIQSMIDHSTSNEDAGIITALCHQNQMDNYDKNAWKVNSPHLLVAIADSDRPSALQELTDTRVMVPELIKGTGDAAIVALDSVGGTILYIRSDLVRQGLAFPHFNMVGTTWSQAGWIGVETEGICYMAKGLKGGGCYVLGGKYHVRHADWG